MHIFFVSRRVSLTLLLTFLVAIPVIESAHAEAGYLASLMSVLKKLGFEVGGTTRFPIYGPAVIEFFGGEDEFYKLLEYLCLPISDDLNVVAKIMAEAWDIVEYEKTRIFDGAMQIIDSSGNIRQLFIEVKSGICLSSERSRTIAQAIRDVYITKKFKKAIIWYIPSTLTKGEKWAERLAEWLEANGIGVTRNPSDALAIARAVDHAFSSAYGIQGTPFTYLVTQLRMIKDKVESALKSLAKNPKVLGTVALVGANVAVSVWEPQDPAQAEVKAALQDALRFANFAWSAYVTVDALVALGSSIALAKGGPIALAAITLLPAIASHAYAAVVGEKPSPYVKAVERSVAPGVSVRVALLDPPDPWLPKKLVVLVNGEAWYAADVSRVANAVDPAVRGARVERGVNGRVVYVTVGERGVGVDVVEVVEGASGGCAYVEVWVRSWDVRVGDVLAGRAPEVRARRVSGPTPRGCNAPQQPPEREAPAGARAPPPALAAAERWSARSRPRSTRSQRPREPRPAGRSSPLEYLT